MGSFANSLHVKSADAKKVSAAVNKILLGTGYKATDEEPDEDAMCGMPSALRAVHVADAHQDWVGLLDSDMMGALSLASDLSGSLKTHAIYFMVNDSDSWAYQLFKDGKQMDEFDSSGEYGDESEMEEISPEFARKLSSAGGLKAFKKDMVQQMQDMQSRWQNEMPAEIREVFERIKRGAANADDMKRYGEWSQGQAKHIMGDFKQMMSGLKSSFKKPQAPKPELERHLKKLRPILPADATDEHVLEVLGKQAVFAEEVFGEFLELLGIQPFFANLSYRYLQECSEADLAGGQVKLVEHLKFKKGGSV